MQLESVFAARQTEGDDFFFFLIYFSSSLQNLQKDFIVVVRHKNQPVVGPEQAVAAPFAAVIIDVHLIPDAPGIAIPR